MTAPQERSGNCVVCHQRDARYPLVCDSCRSRLSRWLEELPGLCAELGTLGFVERDLREGTRAAGVAHRIADRARYVVREPAAADPVAHHLPPGPINGPGYGGRVGGSKEPPVPIRLDPTDLLAPARVLHLATRPSVAEPLLPCRYCRAYHRSGSYRREREQHEPYADQVGHLSVAAVLDGWVRDWREIRHRGEGLPDPTVPTLCRWLGDRLEWACDEHPAIDEVALEIGKVRSTLYGLLGRYDIPEYKEGVPCRSCDALALYRRAGGEYIECGACPALLGPEEYRRWVGLLAAATKPPKRP